MQRPLATLSAVDSVALGVVAESLQFTTAACDHAGRGLCKLLTPGWTIIVFYDKQWLVPLITQFLAPCVYAISSAAVAQQ